MSEVMMTEFGNARKYKGYWRISSSKEGNMGKLLHRLIYEKEHDCTIPEGYVIHHIDGNKTNNDISNLEMLKAGEHNRMHMIGENNPFYGKHLSKETRKKMSNVRKGTKHPQATYMLWDILCVHFNKSYFNENNPLKKSFKYKFKGKQIGIGMFNEFLSCEIIDTLVREAIQ